MSTRTSRAISGTLASFIQFGVRIILQAALAPLVLKVAGQETLGAYSILIQVIGYLALLDVGFGVAQSRYLAQASGYDDNGKRFRDVFETGRTYFLFSNAFYALLVLVFSFFVGRLFSFSSEVENQAHYGLWILAIWSMVRVPFAVYGAALTARQNLAANNIINTVGNVARIVFSLGAVAVGFGLVGLIVSNVVAEVITCVLQRWHYRKLYPSERYHWGIPSWPLFGEMIRYGFGFIFVVIGGRLSFQSDNLVVGLLHGAEKTSIYYITQMPAFLLITFIWVIVDNAGPALNELYARKNTSRLQHSYFCLLKYSTLCGLFLSLGLLIFNRCFISLWVGTKQYAGDVMTVSLAVFTIASVINHVNAYFIGVYGAVRYLAIVSIVGGLANLGLSIILGQVMGMQGVMVASAIVEVVMLVMFWLYNLSLLKISILDVCYRAIKPALVANLFVIPVVAFVYLYQRTISWGMLIFCILCFTSMWAIGTLLAGLDREELAQIQAYLRGMVNATR